MEASLRKYLGTRTRGLVASLTETLELFIMRLGSLNLDLQDEQYRVNKAPLHVRGNDLKAAKKRVLSATAHVCHFLDV